MKRKASLEDYKKLCLKWHNLKKSSLEKGKVSSIKLLNLFCDIALVERSLKKRYPTSEIDKIYFDTLEEVEKKDND